MNIFAEKKTNFVLIAGLNVEFEPKLVESDSINSKNIVEETGLDKFDWRAIRHDDDRCLAMSMS